MTNWNQVQERFVAIKDWPWKSLNLTAGFEISLLRFLIFLLMDDISQYRNWRSVQYSGAEKRLNYDKNWCNIRRLHTHLNVRNEKKECFFVKRTIYRWDGSQGGRRNSRYSKFPLMSRKRNCLKVLSPIFEIDEDCGGEESCVDLEHGNCNLLCRTLGNESLKGDLQEHTNILNSVRCHGSDQNNWQHRSCKEHQVGDKKRASSYLKRDLNSAVSASPEGNKQIVFPDFFPPGMHVHCAHNALPEVSKSLHFKIMQGNSELEHARSLCKTNVTTANTDNSSSQFKQQNWMQFFG